MVRPLNAVATAPPSEVGARAAVGADLRSAIQLLLIGAVSVAFWFLPLGVDPRAQHALAISLFMILAWMVHALDHGITGILGCFLFWTFGLVPFETAFSGFSGTTAWFLFGAICLGLMASKSGLARRLALLILRTVGHSYPRVLLGLIVSDFVLTVIVPSGVARVIIMAAIAMGLVEAFGAAKGSNIARGMFVILVYQATIFDKMMIAGASSITARNAIVKFGQVEVLWGQWFFAYLPCDLLVMIIAWRLALWMYPPEAVSLPGGAAYLERELRTMGRWSPLEIRSGILMTIAIGLWITDLIHHIPPEMIGIGIGLLAMMPRVGVLDTEDVRKINYLPIFFVAAAVTLGDVLAETKALDLLTTGLFQNIGPYIGSTWISTTVLYWSAFVYHIVFGSEIPMLATSIPVLMTYAREQGLDPLRLGMIWTFSAGPKLFIYQSGVLVVGYSYGYFDAKDLLKVGGILSIVTFLILLLLVPLYWPLIGIR